MIPIFAILVMRNYGRICKDMKIIKISIKDDVTGNEYRLTRGLNYDMLIDGASFLRYTLEKMSDELVDTIKKEEINEINTA